MKDAIKNFVNSITKTDKERKVVYMVLMIAGIIISFFGLQLTMISFDEIATLNSTTLE